MSDTDQIYTTVQGDTFDIVAYRVWGDEMLMHELIQANPDHQETVFFPAGIVLNVPELDLPIPRGPVPPWQQ